MIMTMAIEMMMMMIMTMIKMMAMMMGKKSGVICGRLFLLFTSSPKQLRQSNKLSARTCSYLIFVSFFLSYFSHSFYESFSIHLPLFFFTPIEVLRRGFHRMYMAISLGRNWFAIDSPLVKGA